MYILLIIITAGTLIDHSKPFPVVGVSSQMVTGYKDEPACEAARKAVVATEAEPEYHLVEARCFPGP